MRSFNSFSFYLGLSIVLGGLSGSTVAAQQSTMTLTDLVAACKVNARMATGRFSCDGTVGAVGDAFASKCLTVRPTGKIGCDVTGPHAEILSQLMSNCIWANDPVHKDRQGNPMRGKTIECN